MRTHRSTQRASLAADPSPRVGIAISAQTVLGRLTRNTIGAIAVTGVVSTSEQWREYSPHSKRGTTMTSTAIGATAASRSIKLAAGGLAAPLTAAERLTGRRDPSPTRPGRFTAAPHSRTLAASAWWRTDGRSTSRSASSARGGHTSCTHVIDPRALGRYATTSPSVELAETDRCGVAVSTARG